MATYIIFFLFLAATNRAYVYFCALGEAQDRAEEDQFVISLYRKGAREMDIKELEELLHRPGQEDYDKDAWPVIGFRRVDNRYDVTLGADGLRAHKIPKIKK